MNEQEQRLEMIRRALLVEGPRPDIHRAQLRRLQREWPTLYGALMLALTKDERRRLQGVDSSGQPRDTG
jgi:hypothetical protein